MTGTARQDSRSEVYWQHGNSTTCRQKGSNPTEDSVQEDVRWSEVRAQARVTPCDWLSARRCTSKLVAADCHAPRSTTIGLLAPGCFISSASTAAADVPCNAAAVVAWRRNGVTVMCSKLDIDNQSTASRWESGGQAFAHRVGVVQRRQQCVLDEVMIGLDRCRKIVRFCPCTVFSATRRPFHAGEMATGLVHPSPGLTESYSFAFAVLLPRCTCT